MKIKNLFVTTMMAISSVAVYAQSAETFRQPYPLGEKLSPNPNFTGEVWLAPLSEKKELNVPMATSPSSRDAVTAGTRTRQDNS